MQKSKNNSLNFIFMILFIFLIFLLIFIAQNKTFTGNSIQEPKLTLIKDCGQGTILSDLGNLCWQESQMTGTADNWQHADSYCKNLTLANYINWRLPTLEELWTIKEDMKTESDLFSEMRFWTSTPYRLGFKNSHAYINFKINYKDYAPDFRSGYGVKCLRENYE